MINAVNEGTYKELFIRNQKRMERNGSSYYFNNIDFSCALRLSNVPQR
ncbi:hypothetical protein [Mucilaginibacter sp.]|nr:hypothetical protein [Mucilaginibacter sp.]